METTNFSEEDLALIVSGNLTINERGTQQYFNNVGQWHRDDGPAVVFVDEVRWYQNDVLHRDDGPAIVNANGYQSWWQHGQYHRDNGPAVIYPGGTQFWFKHGKQVEPF